MLALVSCCAACNGSGQAVREAARCEGYGPVEIACAAKPMPRGGIVIRYQIRNAGDEVIHIADNGRVPYQIARDANTLVILHGVHEPREGFFPSVIERPLTRPVRPNEIVTSSSAWPARMMLNHYGSEKTPPGLLQGKIRIRCEVGWWTSGVTEANRFTLPLRDVFDSQQVAGCGPFDVTLQGKPLGPGPPLPPPDPLHGPRLAPPPPPPPKNWKQTEMSDQEAEPVDD